MAMFKKITVVSVVSSFILTSPGLDFYQVWAQGKVRPLASGLPTVGFISPNPGSAAGSKWLTDNPEWTLAPTIGPMGAVLVPTQPGMAQVQNAADLSLGLSEDLESGRVSDTQARMESGKVFGLHPVAFKDQLTSITAVLKDLPAETYPRKRTVVSRINHALRDMKKDKLALPIHGPSSMWYPPVGGMRREVPLSPQMGVVFARIENLAEQTRKETFGQPKQKFVELFFSRLSRLEKEMLEPVRRWENRNGIGGPTLTDRLMRQGANLIRAAKTIALGIAKISGDQRGAINPRPQEPAQAQYARAVELYDKGDYQAAAPEFSKAIELNPNLAKAHLYRGHCLAHRSVNDLDGAVQSLRAAVRAEPNSYEAHYYLSIVLYRKGQKEGDSRLLEESRLEEQKAAEISGRLFP